MSNKNTSRELLNDSIQTGINIISSIVVMLTSAAVSFFLSPYIIQNVGEEANGFVQLANNFVTYATLITVALNSMASRFITIYYHKNQKQRSYVYYSSVLWGNIIIIAVLIPVSIWVVQNLNEIIKIEKADVGQVKLLFAFIFLNFFITSIMNVINIFLYVTNEIYIVNLVTMISTLIRAGVLVLLFVCGGTKVYYVTMSSVIASILSVCFYYLLKKKRNEPFVLKVSRFSIRAIKELITAGIWNTINQCGNLLMTGMDLLLTNLFVGPAEMGILAVARVVPTYIMQLAQSVNTSILPKLTISFATSSKEALVKEVSNLIKVIMIIIVVPVTIFGVLGEDFYSLWVPTMDGHLLGILSFLGIVIYIPLGGVQALYNIFTVANKLKINAISFLITGIIKFIITLWGVKYTKYGIFVIVGSNALLTFLRNIVLILPYTSKILGVKWYFFYKDVGRSILCALITGVITGGIKFVIPINSWITLIIVAVLAGIISFVIVMLMLLNQEQKNILFRIIRR